MQISTNGFVSFAPPTGQHVNQFASNNFPLIAPLSADFDFRVLGRVYYRVVDQNCVLMPVVANKIQSLNAGLHASFQPTLCVVVTWFEANLFSASQDLVNVYIMPVYTGHL